MELSNRDILDLKIYDANGKYITTLDLLNKAHIDNKNHSGELDSELYVETQFINWKLLNFLNNDKRNEEELTDFEAEIKFNNNFKLPKNIRSISFKAKPIYPEVMIIAKTSYQDVETGERIHAYYKIKRALIKQIPSFSHNAEGEASSYRYEFRILVDDDSTLYDFVVVD